MDSNNSVAGAGDSVEENGESAMDAVSHSCSVCGLTSFVSAVVHRKLDDSFLLRDYEGKGLWLPCSDVKGGETCIQAAQRLGFEVCPMMIVA